MEAGVQMLTSGTNAASIERVGAPFCVPPENRKAPHKVPSQSEILQGRHEAFLFMLALPLTEYPADAS